MITPQQIKEIMKKYLYVTLDRNSTGECSMTEHSPSDYTKLCIRGMSDAADKIYESIKDTPIGDPSIYPAGFLDSFTFDLQQMLIKIVSTWRRLPGSPNRLSLWDLLHQLLFQYEEAVKEATWKQG